MTKTTFALLSIGCAAIACGDGETALPAEGDFVRYLRVVDYRNDCFETVYELNRVFRSQSEWDSFFTANVICYDTIDTLTPPPVFDFDRYALVMVLHEGDCVYSGCFDSHPLITGVAIEEGVLTIHQRQVWQEELGACLACVQPRDLVLIDAAVADAFPIAFAERTSGPGNCGFAQ